MAFAKTLINQQLTLDEWNKFQVINFALCVGFRPVLVKPIYGNKSASLILTTVAHKGGINISANKMPGSLAVYNMSCIKELFNVLCAYQEDLVVDVDKLISINATLQSVDPLKDKTPLDYTKALCDVFAAPKVNKREDFLKVVDKNYKSTIELLSECDWATNINKALKLNYNLFNIYHNSLAPAGAGVGYNNE